MFIFLRVVASLTLLALDFLKFQYVYISTTHPLAPLHGVTDLKFQYVYISTMKRLEELLFRLSS